MPIAVRSPHIAFVAAHLQAHVAEPAPATPWPGWITPRTGSLLASGACLQTWESECASQPSAAIAGHDHDQDLDATYLQIIIEHHQRGLEAFRTKLANLSSANINDVFAGSMLLVAFALASLRIQNLNDAHSQPGQPRLDWIFLIQGLCTVIKHNWPELRMGPLRDMTQYGYANDDWRLCPQETLRSVSVSGRRGCSLRLLAFCRGADEALTHLINYHETLASRAEETGTGTRHRQILAEQKAALEILEGMYMRTLYVVHFSDEGRDSPQDVQADLEDAAIMSWPCLGISWIHWPAAGCVRRCRM